MAIKQSDRELAKGKRVRAYLKKRDLSASWLARQIAMEHGQLSRTLSGKPTAAGGDYHWRGEIEVKMAEALGVSRTTLFGRDRRTAKS